MKPSSSFKLKKQYKRVAANFVDAHERGKYKRQMIEAQLCAEAAEKQPLKQKDKE